MKTRLYLLVQFFLYALPGLATERFTNFASSKTVNDFAFKGDTVWVATSGGLYTYNEKTKKGTLRITTSSFPDPDIRSVSLDKRGSLWVASHDGYLMAIAPNGSETLFYPYVTANWRINNIIAYGENVIVASDKGVSLFSVAKGSVEKNAAKIGPFTSAAVNAVAVYGDTLYLGCEQGTAKMSIAGGRLEKANFYDPSIWTVDTGVAPVVSFLPDSGKIKAFKGPSGRFNGVVLSTDSTTNIIVNGTTGIGLWSNITSYKVRGGNKCYIGTRENFFCCWDNDGFSTFTIPGPTFTTVFRLLIDKSSKLWVLPAGDPLHPVSQSSPWWLGINSFSGTSWENYTPREIPAMGHMGFSTEASDLIQSRDGSLWFAYTGGSLKSFDQDANAWYHYCIQGKNQEEGLFLRTQGACPAPDWGKCDAVAQDSSGFIWINSWNNYNGSLICYAHPQNIDTAATDAVAAAFRRFPPNGDKSAVVDINTIAVDQKNNIIYGTEGGELTVIRHHGNPLRDGIILVKTFNDLQKIYRAVVLSDGTTLVLTLSGVYRFDPIDNSLTIMEKFNKGITTLVAENDHLFWCGIPSEGILRYDALTDDKTIVGRSQGLISDQVKDLALDVKKGYLWVATDKGVSRMSLGYRETAESKVAALQVFPNPFSFRRHATIYFQNVPADAAVKIYTLHGSLVASATLNRKSDTGAYFQWTPHKGLAPGTYFYSIVGQKSKSTGRLILSL